MSTKKFEWSNLFAIIPIVLLTYMYISAFYHGNALGGLFNTTYSRVCSTAGVGFKVLGIALSIGGFGTIAISQGKTGLIVIGGVLIAISSLSFMGFNV